MKRFTMFALAAAVVVVPTFASAQTTLEFVYRPELRQLVPVPKDTTEKPTLVVRGSAEEEIARHEAMARGYRLNANQRGLDIAATHCDRMIKKAIEESRLAR